MVTHITAFISSYFDWCDALQALQSVLHHATTILKSEIRSTPLDPDELDAPKFKHVSTRGELDQLEQASITEGLEWLNKQKNPELL